MTGPDPRDDAAPTAGWRAVDLIAAKRDGAELDEGALAWLIDGYVAADGPVSDAQMAAFLMAGLCRGFSDAEAAALTRVLVASGDVVDTSGLPAPVVDKHSTGGVGDSTTLLVAPLVAAAGATLVKLSGRGLGHTGGTLDKLEAVPGLRTDLEPDELHGIAARVGCAVAAQSPRLVPADAALYALRDVTATVPDPALIAASVMSKKLAGGAPTLVLDVKAGRGAFLPTPDAARDLAGRCARIGHAAGRQVAALVTAMDQPLGTAVGNALEVGECARLLAAPPRGRLAAVALELASHLVAAGRQADAERPDAVAIAAVRDELARRWAEGEASERLRALIPAQGGDPAVVDDPDGVLPRAPGRREVPAPHAGTVRAVDARAVGELVARLGAGRAAKGEAIDPAVGLRLHVEVGSAVAAGEPLAQVHAREDAAADAAAAALLACVEIGEEPVEAAPLVHAVVG